MRNAASVIQLLHESFVPRGARTTVDDAAAVVVVVTLASYQLARDNER
jgi:hypothetical protein